MTIANVSPDLLMLVFLVCVFITGATLGVLLSDDIHRHQGK
jgi:hypothetical protein